MAMFGLTAAKDTSAQSNKAESSNMKKGKKRKGDKIDEDSPTKGAPERPIVKIRQYGHVFHKDCLLEWVTEDDYNNPARRSYPYCRLLVLDWSDYELTRRELWRFDQSLIRFERQLEIAKDLALMWDLRQACHKWLYTKLEEEETSAELQAAFEAFCREKNVCTTSAEQLCQDLLEHWENIYHFSVSEPELFHILHRKTRKER